jgi:5S rRNA maturation endonuclease (ribonuclease M5)
LPFRKCHLCGRQIDTDYEPHGRQARLALDGKRKRARYDVFLPAQLSGASRTRPRGSHHHSDDHLGEFASTCLRMGCRYCCRCWAPARRAGHWSAVCPAHNDHTPSLDITIGNKGLPVVTCRVCGPDRQREVLAAVEAAGVPRWVWKAEYEPGGPDDKPQVVTSARYEARDWNGTLVATHHRQDLDRPDERGRTKRIWWERNGKNSLDGLHPNDLPLWGTELLRQHPRNGVVITEGEKDAAALRAAGIKLALATYGAESTPSVSVLQPLAGRSRYVLWPDNDEPGRAHMQRLAGQLVAAGCAADRIQLVRWETDAKGAGCRGLAERTHRHGGGLPGGSWPVAGRGRDPAGS